MISPRRLAVRALAALVLLILTAWIAMYTSHL
jgi:hypothetical protein